MSIPHVQILKYRAVHLIHCDTTTPRYHNTAIPQHRDTTAPRYHNTAIPQHHNPHDGNGDSQDSRSMAEFYIAWRSTKVKFNGNAAASHMYIIAAECVCPSPFLMVYAASIFYCCYCCEWWCLQWWWWMMMMAVVSAAALQSVDVSYWWCQREQFMFFT